MKEQLQINEESLQFLDVDLIILWDATHLS